ncbi:zinc ion binding [Tyrophagus putrescentiae]|nr:zinc ion binding [Tyrophagus putrescentiae]
MPHHLMKICRVCGDRAIAFNFNDEGAHCSPSSARHSPVSTNAVEEVIWRDLVHFFKEEKEDESTISSNSCKEVKPKVSTSGGDQATFHLEKLFNQAESEVMKSVERSLISEINLATAAHFKEELQLEVKGEVATFKDGLNLPGVYIMHIIRFCKMLTPFRLLSQADQMAILKPYFTELLLARFTFAYSHKEDSFPVYNNKDPTYALWMKVSRLEEVSEQLAAFAKHYRQFIISTQKEMENDVTIRNLLITLLMFCHREGLSNPEFLRYHYFVYQHLLHRYLLEKYDGSVEKAEEKWHRLQVVLDEVTKYRVPICALYTLVEVAEVESVLTEIYDLGQQMRRMSIGGGEDDCRAAVFS